MEKKETVVSHAETDNNVQPCPCPAQQLRLGDWVAQGFILPRVDFFLVLETNLLLGNGPNLAANTADPETIGFQDFLKEGGFMHETHAGGNPQVGDIEPAGEFHDFLHARPLAIASCFHLGCSARQLLGSGI